MPNVLTYYISGVPEEKREWGGKFSRRKLEDTRRTRNDK